MQVWKKIFFFFSFVSVEIYFGNKNISLSFSGIKMRGRNILLLNSIVIDSWIIQEDNIKVIKIIRNRGCTHTKPAINHCFYVFLNGDLRGGRNLCTNGDRLAIQLANALLTCFLSKWLFQPNLHIKILKFNNQKTRIFSSSLFFAFMIYIDIDSDCDHQGLVCYASSLAD